MSSSISRRSSATAHPTRQQLDELDALLKRMLDLPVNRGEDDAAPEPAEPAPEAAASAPEPLRGPHRPAVNYTTEEEDEAADLKPRVVADDPPAEAKKPDDWVPLAAAWKPSARTWKPLSDAWKQAQASVAPPEAHEPSLAPEPTPDAAPEPPPMPAAASPPEPPAAAPPVVGMPRLTVGRWSPVWALAAFNAGFDFCLTPWGAPGRWLRGRAGRWLLAAVGLVCLAAAVGLIAADRFGWTR